MSVYHLHARALEGPLEAPSRDEVRVTHTDDADEAEAWARRHLQDGFTVWIYDHRGTPTRLVGASDLRLIAHYRPHERDPRQRVPPDRGPDRGAIARTVEHLRAAHRT